eukprot:767716-Hanusia_phi.AAC.3
MSAGKIFESSRNSPIVPELPAPDLIIKNFIISNKRRTMIMKRSACQAPAPPLLAARSNAFGTEW